MRVVVFLKHIVYYKSMIEEKDAKEPLVPFWEEAYKSLDGVTSKSEPNGTVKEFEGWLQKDAHILEVGCGEGQNCIYLAKRGFRNIDAFDLSENGIAKLKRLCAQSGAELNAFVADLTTFSFEKRYDLIMSFGTLHFVKREEWKGFLARAKEHTREGGIHIMQIFTDAVSASSDIAPFAVGLARDGEIKEAYKDWEIVQFKSYVFEDEHPNVPKHLHASNKIVARKKDNS